jgi:hypothetical protein
MVTVEQKKNGLFIELHRTFFVGNAACPVPQQNRNGLAPFPTNENL